MTKARDIQRSREIMATHEVLRRDRKAAIDLDYGRPYIGFGEPLETRLRLWAANAERLRLTRKRIAFTEKRISQRTDEHCRRCI